VNCETNEESRIVPSHDAGNDLAVAFFDMKTFSDKRISSHHTTNLSHLTTQ
jgi:hypothetical protein